MLFIPFAVSPQSLIFGPTGLVFVAVILGAFGVFWQAAKESEAQRQLVVKSEEIAQKSEEIADLNKRIAGLVTGGDGFCYLWLANIDSEEQFGDPVLVSARQISYLRRRRSHRRSPAAKAKEATVHFR